MDNPNNNTGHKKGQHLTYENRMTIQIRLKDGNSPASIAKELGCAYNTVKNEIERGSVELYNGAVKRYKADAGQRVYREHRQNSRRQYKTLEVSEFLKYVTEKFYGIEHWSLDACTGYALQNGIFERSRTVCTKTLYNYVDNGLLKIKNIDLPQKLRRGEKTKRVRKNVKKLGKSIEERPPDIERRSEFGHWEADTVIGSKTADDAVILTLVERMTRDSVWLKIPGKTASAVNDCFNRLKDEYGDKFSEVFKSITGDNGSELSELSRLEAYGSQVYFTHPYASYEKGTNERHNGLLRRFVPAGRRIENYSDDDISFIADWSNGLPRKLLGYKTPEELFEAELDHIYSKERRGVI